MSLNLINPYLLQPPAVEATDVYRNYVASLLDATGVEGTQNNTYLDSGPNNVTITTNGSPNQSSFTPYGTNWSYYFDGTGDAITVPDSASWAYGTGDFTIEGWVFPTNTSTFRLFTQYSTSTAQIFIQVGSGTVRFANLGVSGLDYTSTPMVMISRWNHIAVVRTGSKFTTYINGVTAGSLTSTASLADYTTALYIGGMSTGVESLKGYISDFRIVKGSALYFSDFTPPKQSITAVDNTVLLTCQSNRFVSNHLGTAVVVSRVGDVKCTNFGPYEDTSATGMYSYKFDGTTDNLQLQTSPFFQIGTGDFTIEGWIYFTALGGTNGVYDGRNAGNAQGPHITATATGEIVGGIGTTNITSATGLISISTWYHVALVRSSGTLTLYLNGTSVASGTVTNNIQANYGVIGKTIAGSNMTGFVSNLRFNANAVYTGNFTVSKNPLVKTSNTILLTCNSSSLKDYSDNNFTMTRNADVVPYTFVPFQVNEGVSDISVIDKYNDWSASFNGSSSYIQSGSSLAGLKPGSQDFTIELWYYHLGGSSRMDLFNLQGTSFERILLYYTGTALQYDSGTGSPAASRISHSIASSNLFGKWVHIALCRSAGSTKLFLNGAQVGSTYADTQTWSSAMQFTSGRDPGGTTYVTGYISNIRYTIGYGLYTTTFVPPKVMTAVTGTVMHILYDALPETNGGTLYIPLNKFNLVAKKAGPQGLTLDNTTRTRSHSSLAKQTGWSVGFSGVNYIQYTATQARYNLGTADFTVEAWVMPTQINTAGDNLICGFRNGTAGTYYTLHINTDGYLSWVDGSASYQGPYVALNSWSHVAVVRLNSKLRFYVDGVEHIQSFDYTRNLTAASVAAVGFNVGGKPGSVNDRNFIGYISNVRVVKSAVYTSNFTPTTNNLTDISGTSLLACQDQFANDVSSQAATKSIYATPYPVSPILNTLPATATNLKGSMYFSGGAEYLTMDSNSNLSPIGAGEYLWEAWIYPLTATGVRGLWSSGQTADCLCIGLDATNKIRVYRNAVSGETVDFTSTTVLRVYEWTHVVVKKQTTVTMIWINGVNTDTTGTSQTYTTPSATLASVGRRPSRAEDFVGYMAGMRFVQGAPAGSQYMYNTGAIAPPVYPPASNQTNTKLSLEFNNAGIIDRAMFPSVLVSGNAKTSTAVSKFGGTSLSFDGSGDYVKLYSGTGSTDYELGPYDFTIEFWVRFNDVNTTAVLVDFRNGAQGTHPTIYSLNGQLKYFTSSGDRITSPDTFVTDTWYHVAVVRTTGMTLATNRITKLYVNGVSVGTPYVDTTTYSSTAVTFGISGVNFTDAPLNGYIDEPRITRGVARYVDNFTPPTQPFPRK